jgi:hypothetical protein
MADGLPAGDAGIRRAVQTSWSLDALATVFRFEVRGEGGAGAQVRRRSSLALSLSAGEPSDPKERGLLKRAGRWPAAEEDP